MNGVIRRVYLGTVCLFVVIFLLLQISYRLKVQRPQDQEEFKKVQAVFTGQEYEQYAPMKLQRRYLVPLEDIGESTHLMFETLHQEVEVYAGEKCIYRMFANRQNPFGKTPGCVWNDVLLESTFLQEDIIIVLKPVYSVSTDAPPFLYLGGKSEIVKKIFAEEGMEFILSIITILVGVFLAGFVVYNRFNAEIDRNLSGLGAFAASIGLWKLSDGGILKLLFPRLPAISMLPFLCLMLAVVPFIMYIQNLLRLGKPLLWDVLYWISIVEVGLCILLQYAKLLDFRQTFGLTIGVIVISAVALIVVIAMEVKRRGWNMKLGRDAATLLFCFMGIGVDMGIYYLGKGVRTSMLGILIFLVYILSQTIIVMKEANSLALEGKMVQDYEQMAYHDQLTGLFNRAALARDTDVNVFDTHNAIVIMMDLNDLKKCNDTLGHDKGDAYIKESSKLISEVFSGYGNCYRTGGDEFLCVMKAQESSDLCKARIAVLRQRVEEYNAKSPDIRMSIACGYAKFDKRLDYSVDDIAKRADARMYEDKKRLKEQAQKESEGKV